MVFFLKIFGIKNSTAAAATMALGLAAAACLEGSSLAWGRPLVPSDLAIVLEPIPSGPAKIAMGPDFFPQTWWDESLALYAQTPVGQALTIENRSDEWQLVAVRIAPCQPLIPFLTPENERFCAAELRIVWQPFTYTRPGAWRAVADDRAFHVTYRLNGSTILAADKAARYGNLQSRGLNAIESPSAADQRDLPLRDSDLATYESLHREMVHLLVNEVKDLAQVPLDGEIDVRPEFRKESTRRVFVHNLRQFLRKHARPSQLAEVTGFSLPEGRDPPLLDEWVFIALEPVPTENRENKASRKRAQKVRNEPTVTLRPKDIRLLSRHTGEELLRFGPHTTVSMHRDDDRIFDMMDSLSEAARLEVEQTVILRFGAKRSLKKPLANVRETHVSHTTCGSCHKLNSQPFDFHNLSYYLDHPVTVSPRVVEDVAHDLSWLQKRGIE